MGRRCQPQSIEPKWQKYWKANDSFKIREDTANTAKGSYPLVAVLLCTHHGARFLSEQLISIKNQTHKNFTIWASDDNSKDATHSILEQYQNLWGEDQLLIGFGPQKDFIANFLFQICNKDIEADYFAYADQDDIWEPDKLSRAIVELERVPKDVPSLYCSRTRLVDEKNRDIGYSPLFKKSPAFTNALVQNIGGGNTMVMNKAACKLLRSAGEKVVVSHDWWTYLLITGAGGTVIYDSYPSVRYRQHNYNLVGSNITLGARISRILMLLKGRFQNWNTINTQALLQVRNLLTTENQCILDNFCTARKQWLISRIWGIGELGLYRQTFMGNLGLIAATVLNKL